MAAWARFPDGVEVTEGVFRVLARFAPDGALDVFASDQHGSYKKLGNAFLKHIGEQREATDADVTEICRRFARALGGNASAALFNSLAFLSEGFRGMLGDQVMLIGRLEDTDTEEMEGGLGQLARLFEQPEEIAEIEAALEVSLKMYSAAVALLSPGRYEWELRAALVGAAVAQRCEQSFSPIVTIHGEVLHNHSSENSLPAGGLILIDSGAETVRGYASDITRCFPISGRFDPRQRDIYAIVLDAQESAIAAARPGVSMKELHLLAARRITQGLSELGLMRGDPDEAVAAGAHALFFPHGLGHMLGLDAHDMEDLGDIVGYGPDASRDPQFGLSALRMARTLEPGFVFTVEPGVYFIPELIEQWSRQGTNAAFLDFECIAGYVGMGGIRIEDDLVVTTTGARVLGPGIPKSIAAVEDFIAALSGT